MKRTAIYLITMFLIMGIPACSPDGPTTPLPTEILLISETQEQTSTETTTTSETEAATPGESPFLLQLTARQTFDELIVFGLLRNTSGSSWEETLILLEKRDSDGQLIDSRTVQPALTTIPAGESSPFIGRFPGGDTEVAVTGEVVQQSMTSEQKAHLNFQNQRFIPQAGEFTSFTAVVSNENDHPVLVEAVSAVIWDSTGQIASISSEAVYTQYLDPYETSPLKIDFEIQEFIDSENMDYLIFWDAHDVPFYPVYNLVIGEDGQSSLDANGDFLLTVELENKDFEAVAATLVAGVYDVNGDVLDASLLNTGEMQLVPGELRTLEFRDWEILQHMPGLIDELSTYSIQWDPARTNPGE